LRNNKDKTCILRVFAVMLHRIAHYITARWKFHYYYFYSDNF